VVDRLARCAELSGDHATAVTSLRELIALATDDATRADAGRRLAGQYEMQGHWPQALTARETAADLLAHLGRPAEAAVERLTVAAHLRSAAGFRAALDTLDTAEMEATKAGRVDLVCRIGGLRGNVQARMGRADEGLHTVRGALNTVLEHGFTTPAAEIYQRLADSLEHAGDYRGAGHAYDAAYEFCHTHARDAAAQLCRACATIVLFQTGQWDQALKLGRSVLADPAATVHARAVAAGAAGLVHAMRGQRAAARAALLDCRSAAGRIDLIAMQLLSTWGFALLDDVHAADSYRQVVKRCQETEERHYCVPILQFAAARFAADGATADLGATTALLADAAAPTGRPEARAAFAYALAESESDPERAIPHLHQALDRLAGLDLPLADAMVRHRTAVALATVHSLVPAEAVDLLHQAHRTARRLKAGPFADRIAADLARFGRPSTDTPLSPREMQVLRLVGDGLTSREIGQRLFLSVRTVEMHVRNAMTKLDCRTRAEAVRRLG
jgi:DNA-binding CsgD family transcriptional regulator/tetratricopeptide (TPR) repeat protein